jgi:signal transduction histidine kinase
VALLNSSGTIVAVNESWLRLASRVGPSADQVGVGSNYLEAFRQASETPSTHSRRAMTGVRSVLSGKAPSFLMEYPCPRFSQQAWFRLTASRMSYADSRIVISYSDITKHRFNNDGEKRNLRWFAGRLIHAREEERRRISRELHDDLGQRIALLSFSIDHAMSRGATSDSGTEKLSDIHQRIADLAASLRSLSHSLHPPMLDAGIGSAIEALCKDFQKTSGVQLDVHVSAGIAKLPVEVELCIFRIAQECLQNIAKHSGAQSGCVRLERKARQIRLVVSDNGKGFEASEQGSKEALGLINIRERVRYFRGHLDVQSTPSRGTEVRVTIPVSPNS